MGRLWFVQEKGIFFHLPWYHGMPLVCSRKGHRAGSIQPITNISIDVYCALTHKMNCSIDVYCEPTHKMNILIEEKKNLFPLSMIAVV